MGYLMHWFVVIPWVALKMALLPKRLVWAKTAHGAAGVEQDLEEEFDDDDVVAIEVATESGGG
jgi:1,2-diacylglycerol 3-beta-glucosyltransferase